MGTTRQAKNKTSAPVQITAEQIIREARDRQEAAEFGPLKQKIADSTELSDYRLRRRKDFEDQIRCAGRDVKAFVNYARWEESREEYARARSVFERALGASDHYKNRTLWLKYAEFEMKNKFVNSARNVWDRAVALLPRVDQLWYKYIHMEEMLGNVAGARQIFHRWINCSPDQQQAWLSFIKFELRYNEIERARSLYERFVLIHPKASSFIRYAKFEMKIGGGKVAARQVYERASEMFKGDDEEEAEILFVSFAEFEGDRGASLRAAQVKKEKKKKKSPLDYDSWFDDVRREEALGNNKDRIREIYERAIANVPPAEEKRYWQRYIYLWINYALYEDIETGDVDRTRAVYRQCLKLIPHTKFSFAKIWLLAAQFEIRQLNLTGARQILGNAIGKAPSKDKIFKKYIEIELQLGNIDWCRKLYERYLEWSPENCYAWCKYAEFERSLSETERVGAIFELAISQPALDMPELLWKAYIDFEISQGELDRTRGLYERLLDGSKHYKVWVSFAKFEASTTTQQGGGGDGRDRARAVFNRAYSFYKDSAPELKEERATLLDEWLGMEMSFGKLGDVSVVQSKLKKRKSITLEDVSKEYEEYNDYLFPEESQTANLKILEAAYKWKKQKVCEGNDV
ncbi:unnamed protein product [Cochlearia groenlandica]